MRAAAHNRKFAEKAGIPQKVAREFENADEEKARKGFHGFLKDAPTSTGVHIPTALGNEKKRKQRKVSTIVDDPHKESDMAIGLDKSDWKLTARVSKVDQELGVIYGWASIVVEDGKYVVDRQGDVIPEIELVKAAHNFMLTSRSGGLMHEEDLRTGDIVESMVLTRDVQKALGVDLKRSGWWIGYKPHDPEVLKAAKDGKLPAFSIGGRGRRTPI